MHQCKSGWLGSTIGRKQLIALTGLGLSLFVFIHMAGNMLILVGAKAYNQYSHALTSNPLLPIAEIGLVVMFLLHFVLAIGLSLRNGRARDTRYAVLANGAKRTSLVQRSLWIQGLFILVFVIGHLYSFKYGTHFEADYGQGPIRDLFKLVIENFHDPIFVAWYVVALLILGAHLSHGIGSSINTLGFNHPRYAKPIRCVSILYAAVVAGGFIVQPIYVYLLT